MQQYFNTCTVSHTLNCLSDRLVSSDYSIVINCCAVTVVTVQMSPFYLLVTQARDDVNNDDDLAEQSEAAIDNVTSQVTMTSRRLSDVIDRAQSVSTSVREQFGDSALDAITAVSLPNLCSLSLWV